MGAGVSELTEGGIVSIDRSLQNTLAFIVVEYCCIISSEYMFHKASKPHTRRASTRHSERGRVRDALTTSGPKATSADMTSIHTLDNPDQRRPSATAASPARSSQQTSTGRSPSCESDILTPRSSGTSAPDSTSGAEGCSPYWNDYTREISSVLWSPTETVLQGLEQTHRDAARAQRRGARGSQSAGPQPRRGAHD